jgi:hypothetical protein
MLSKVCGRRRLVVLYFGYGWNIRQCKFFVLLGAPYFFFFLSFLALKKQQQQQQQQQEHRSCAEL